MRPGDQNGGNAEADLMENESFMKYFTKKECYPNQHEAMAAIANALKQRSGVLFEGACGTGKTLSALAPALAVAAENHQVVIIVTNVHQQMVQFISEARGIRRKVPLNVIVMKGKQAMCPDSFDYEECRARSENSYELVKAENEAAMLLRDLRDATEKFRETGDPSWREDAEDLEKRFHEAEPGLKKMRSVSCPYLYEIIKSDSPVFRTWLFDDVRSPEEINEYAAERGMCGYELLKKELKRADLIICNYHHVLDPDIFSMILGRMERSPEDVILIFDEAHNIENAARSHSSITIPERVIDRAINEIEENAHRFPETIREDAERLLLAFYDSVRETWNFKLGPAGKNRIGNTWTDIRISDPVERFDIVRERFMKKLGDLEKTTGRRYTPEDVQKLMIAVSEVGSMIENSYYENYKNGNGPLKKSYISGSADFLSAYLLLSTHPNYYPILNVRRDRRDNEIYGRLELFACIPRNVTRDLFNMVGGFVLMSATLRPFSMIKETLGIERDCTEIAFGTTFPEDRRRTFAVSVPPLFSNRRNDIAVSNTVELCLITAIRETPGNVLIYFQSSAEAEKYTSFLRAAFGDSLPVLSDVAGTSSNEIREQFFRIGEAGGKAVLVSYILGTLSEGVDFRHGRARSVIIVGVGYPALNDRVRAVETAYDTVFGEGTGWEFSILVPTIRRVRQAMGRVVRSPTDYGIRILLDARYQIRAARSLGKYSVVDSFPDEERREIIDISPTDLGKEIAAFFEKFKDEENEFRKSSRNGYEGNGAAETNGAADCFRETAFISSDDPGRRSYGSSLPEQASEIDAEYETDPGFSVPVNEEPETSVNMPAVKEVRLGRRRRKDSE